MHFVDQSVHDQPTMILLTKLYNDKPIPRSKIITFLRIAHTVAEKYYKKSTPGEILLPSN